MHEDTIQFNKTKYLSLETYRKNGVFVRTPVWFVVEDKDFFVITKSETGKVKRLRNNPKVRISPCNFRGKIKVVTIHTIVRCGSLHHRSGGEAAQHSAHHLV